MTLKIQKSLRGWLAKFVVIGFLTALFTVIPMERAFAQTAPTLGTAQSFAVLGGSAVTNTGPTIITGDLGVSPGTAITGFPPGIVVGGAIHAADAVALQAQNDTATAYNELAGQPCNTTFIVPTDIGGMTLVPGVYCFASSVQLTGTLTLDAGGNGGGVWIFEVGSTLITASNSSVSLINGAQQCNDYWQVGSSATLGTGTVSTSAGTPPKVGKTFSPVTILSGGTSTLNITLTNPNATVATITAPFTDVFPSGIVVSGGASTSCGGTLTAVKGSSQVTLTGGSIPANGSCKVTLTVAATPTCKGLRTNSLVYGVLQTNKGANTVPAYANITVN